MAILFTDMEDFTRYVERGDDVAFAVLKEHNRIVRQTVERWGGKIVKGYGNGLQRLYEVTTVPALAPLDSEIEAELARLEDEIRRREGEDS